MASSFTEASSSPDSVPLALTHALNRAVANIIEALTLPRLAFVACSLASVMYASARSKKALSVSSVILVLPLAVGVCLPLVSGKKGEVATLGAMVG